MASDDRLWLDAQAGPVVRPYALTRGRTRPGGEAFDLVSTVSITSAWVTDPDGLEPEHVSVLQLARRPTTVVDIASDVDLPLGVVRILLADLREARPDRDPGARADEDPTGGQDHAQRGSPWPTGALNSPAG